VYVCVCVCTYNVRVDAMTLALYLYTKNLMCVCQYVMYGVMKWGGTRTVIHVYQYLVILQHIARIV